VILGKDSMAAKRSRLSRYQSVQRLYHYTSGRARECKLNSPYDLLGITIPPGLTHAVTPIRALATGQVHADLLWDLVWMAAVSAVLVNVALVLMRLFWECL